MVYSCILQRELTLNIYSETTAEHSAVVLQSSERHETPSRSQGTNHTSAFYTNLYRLYYQVQQGKYALMVVAAVQPQKKIE